MRITRTLLAVVLFLLPSLKTEAMVDLGVDYITSDYPTKVRYIINNTK